MATGQSILNLMESLSPELQLQSGENDVTKGLAILNASQDLLETLLAANPQVLGGAVGTVSTTANQEYTTFPSGVLRLDGLDLLDSNGAVIQPIFPTRQRGGHAYNKAGWAQLVGAGAGMAGRPAVYWTNGTRLYWGPTPDTVYTVRYYGFASASDITASGTFAYPDSAMLPLASLSVRIIRTGLDDPAGDVMSLAKDILNPYIDMVANFNRDGSHGLQYDYNHDT